MGGIMSQTVNAQVHVDLNLNIGIQPIWGPVGYDHVEYYYLPDIEVFYYVPDRQYVYIQSGRWVFSSNLPYRYRNFDLYSGYKVVINEPRPYYNYSIYKEKYREYRGNQSQEVIRNSHDTRYYVNKRHPEHKNWKKSHNKKGNHGNPNNN
jgi:hypothetical protein